MKIKAHKLEGAPFRAAHAFGGEMRPELIVLHDTAGRLNPGSSVDWFVSDECPNSAHVVVERDGSITQMVAFNRKAWHAGASVFKGRQNCNAFAIGIEIVNPGLLDKDGRAWFHKKTERGFDTSDIKHVKTDAHGDGWWMSYTPQQIEAVTKLCRALCETYGISDITTHWFISPKRKIDPNPIFPLDEVRRAVLNKSEPEVANVEAAPEPPKSESVVSKASGMFAGYSFAQLNDLADQGSRLADKIRSFKRWLWGTTATVGTASTLIDTKKGTAHAFTSLVADHPFLFVGVVGIVLAVAIYIAVKLIEKYVVTAARAGRYVPRGG